MKSASKMFLLFFLFLLGGCNKLFEYSPYAINFNGENSNINQTNINRLSFLNENDTIQIAFTGDSHNNFDELELFVEKVNAMEGIDFVVHVGDIADFGLPKQYLWGNSYLLNLRIPYLVTIGNHDLVGNGMEAYIQMFGELNFSFVYQGIKFVFLNTNSLEFAYNGKVPDLDWLTLQLIPNCDFNKAVVIFHMPPGIGFDPNLEARFYQIISHNNNNVIMAVHGHAHHFAMYYPTSDSVPFINVYGVEHRKMTSIKIFQNQLYVKNFEF